jgi:NADH-quinone oxidoreductase subunit A
VEQRGVGSNPINDPLINKMRITILNIFLESYDYDYMGLAIFFLICTLLACILFGLSCILSPENIYAEKLSAYECGFEPFDEARKTFDVHFYIIAILFIIFDLEVAFLFP